MEIDRETLSRGRLARPDEREKAKTMCETAMKASGIGLDAFVRVKPEEAPRLKEVMGSEDTPFEKLRGRVVAIGWVAGIEQVMAQVHTTGPGGSGINNDGCCTIVQLDCLEELPPPDTAVN